MTTPSRRHHVDAVVAAQNSSHTEGHDYAKGSPHLRHDELRTMTDSRLSKLVAASVTRTGSCRVLEIGAGHGTFTQCLLEAGAMVTVTETSSASAEHLRGQFGDRVEVRFDETGDAILDSVDGWDLAVMTSVIHHIPDYLSFLGRLANLVEEGGAIFTVQDPLYYPRMSTVAHTADRACYFIWRLGQGSYLRGLATRIRRMRGVYLDNEPSDLVEYHVMRAGVDEEAIAEKLAALFDDVAIFRYWSTQSPLLQRLGRRTGWLTTFGIEATGRRR